eukprot:1136864-Pelagomonas_calceolata.AAC.6
MPTRPDCLPGQNIYFWGGRDMPGQSAYQRHAEPCQARALNRPECPPGQNDYQARMPECPPGQTAYPVRMLLGGREEMCQASPGQSTQQARQPTRSDCPPGQTTFLGEKETCQNQSRSLEGYSPILGHLHSFHPPAFFDCYR